VNLSPVLPVQRDVASAVLVRKEIEGEDVINAKDAEPEEDVPSC
jgi:hypothetical protein